MPLFNINELQNLEDLKYLSQLSDQQQIQALANLGQRLGIKGDSVAYGSFTFLDLLDNNYIPNADNEPEIGILNYYLHPGKNCVFSEIGTTTTDERYVHDKKPLNNLLTKHNEENVFYQQFFLNNFELETKINNIEYYNANSIFNKDGNILKVLLFGKLMGMNDNENNNIEIQYNEFDLAANELKRGIRTYYGYSLNSNEHYYILLDFVRCHDEDGDNDYKDYYDLSVYILNSKDVLEDLNIDITELYKLTNIDTNEEFANVAEKYVNILGKKYFNEYNLFNLFIERGYSAKYKNMKIKFDVAENKLLMNESNENLKYIESILVNTSEISIYNRIDYVNIDIEYLYPQIFAYYDHHSYKLNKGVLYKHIMFSLYEKLLSEYDIDASYIDEFPVMYIPLDQKIYYLHNKENDFIVYFSNDIHVNKIDFSTYTPSKIKEILKSDTILFDYSCVHSNDVAKVYDNKQSVYQIHVIYNDKYKSLINDINVINVYTLPYINSRNHWVVNDIDTNVIAKAAVTNDQTLLLIHNYYDNSSDKFACNIISNINNNEIFERSLEHQDIVEVELSENRVLKCYLPKLDDENYEYFKDILLILISDSSCIFYNDTSIGSDDNKMCTFWQTTIDDNNNMSFKILRIDDNDILDGKNIFNFDELKTWFKQNIDMENNMFDQVLFNIKQTQVMNQSVEKTTQFTGKVGYEDPVTLMKQVKTLYPKFVSSAEYYNNLNMILGTYNNKGLTDGYHDEDNKFIKDTKENYVTNSLYIGNKIANLNMNSVLDDSNTSTKVIGILEKLGLAQFEIDGSQEIKTYKLADILEEEFVSIMAIQEQIEKINEEVISETPELYKEFDFNYNVPELDIKEFILKNINILNRMNILSLDKNGNLYNAFLGTDFDNENKNELLLTSIPTNINIGQNTLIDPKCTTRFNTHDTLRILFNKIILEGNEIVFGKNIQTYEHPSTGLYKYEDPSSNKEWLKPHTIHINSIVEPLYDLLITTVNNNETDAYYIPENAEIENTQYFVKVEPQRLFNYSNEADHVTKLFYEFIEHHVYEGTFDPEHKQNDEPMRFSDTIIGNANSSSIASEAKFKLIMNWSYLLRQYGIIDIYTVIDSIWYNNKKYTPKSLDVLDSTFMYNEENFIYNGEMLWVDGSKHQDKNPNIISFLDEDDYVLIRKENPDTLFTDNTTVILNTEINITYWIVSEEEDMAGVKTKHICLCINDGGLGAKASNIRLHWENEIAHS